MQHSNPSENLKNPTLIELIESFRGYRDSKDEAYKRGMDETLLNQIIKITRADKMSIFGALIHPKIDVILESQKKARELDVHAEEMLKEQNEWWKVFLSQNCINARVDGLFTPEQAALIKPEVLGWLVNKKLFKKLGESNPLITPEQAAKISTNGGLEAWTNIKKKLSDPKRFDQNNSDTIYALQTLDILLNPNFQNKNGQQFLFQLDINNAKALGKGLIDLNKIKDIDTTNEQESQTIIKLVESAQAFDSIKSTLNKLNAFSSPKANEMLADVTGGDVLGINKFKDKLDVISAVFEHQSPRAGYKSFVSSVEDTINNAPEKLFAWDETMKDEAIQSLQSIRNYGTALKGNTRWEAQRKNLIGGMCDYLEKQLNNFKVPDFNHLPEKERSLLQKLVILNFKLEFAKSLHSEDKSLYRYKLWKQLVVNLLSIFFTAGIANLIYRASQGKKGDWLFFNKNKLEKGIEAIDESRAGLVVPKPRKT